MTGRGQPVSLLVATSRQLCVSRTQGPHGALRGRGGLFAKKGASASYLSAPRTGVNCHPAALRKTEPEKKASQRDVQSEIRGPRLLTGGPRGGAWTRFPPSYLLSLNGPFLASPRPSPGALKGCPLAFRWPKEERLGEQKGSQKLLRANTALCSRQMGSRRLERHSQALTPHQRSCRLCPGVRPEAGAPPASRAPGTSLCSVDYTTGSGTGLNTLS